MMYFTTQSPFSHRRRFGLITLGVSIVAVSAAVSVYAAQNSGPRTTVKAETDEVERLVRDPMALTESLLGDTKTWQRGQRIEQIGNHVLGLDGPASVRADRILGLGMESFGGVLWGLRDAAQIVEDLAAEQPGTDSSLDLRSAVIDLQRYALHMLMHAPERDAWVAFLAPGAIEDVKLFWAAVQDATVGIEDESFRTTQLVNAWRVTIAGYYSVLGEHVLAAEAHERALEQLFALDDDALARYLAGFPNSGMNPEWLLRDKAVELVRAKQTAAAIETLDRIKALPESLRAGPIQPGMPAHTLHQHAQDVTMQTRALRNLDFPIAWLDRIEWEREANEHVVNLFSDVLIAGGDPTGESHAERRERLDWMARRGEFLLQERPDLLEAANALVVANAQRFPGLPEPVQQYEFEIVTANMMYGMFNVYQKLGRRDKALAIGEQFLERYSDYEGAAVSVADGVFRMRKEIR